MKARQSLDSDSRPLDLKSDPARKREQILDAALGLFAHEPFQAVTMERVAGRAGVAKGTLYLYFSSKEELYLGILSDGLENIARQYQQSVVADADVCARLCGAIDTSFRFYSERRDFLKLVATEEPRLAEARNRLIQQWRSRGSAFFTNLIEEGIASGAFAPVDARVATLMILGGIRSVLLFYSGRRPVAELSRDFVKLILGGLRTGVGAGAKGAAR